MSWIELHPDATRKERIVAMAKTLVGTSQDPTWHTLEEYGLEEDFDIGCEQLEYCLAFDAEAIRCTSCDWWVSPFEIDDNGECNECQND